MRDMVVLSEVLVVAPSSSNCRQYVGLPQTLCGWELRVILDPVSSWTRMTRVSRDLTSCHGMSTWVVGFHNFVD